MTDKQPAEKKRKGMLGFYIGLGVVALLLVGFHFAWTPLRVWYWEREVRRASPWHEVKMEPGSSIRVLQSQRTRAARSLADIGPSAEAAFERLLSVQDAWWPNGVLTALDRPDDSWALPLLIKTAGSDDARLAEDAIRAAQRITGASFFPPMRSVNAISDIPLGGRREPKGVGLARSKLFKWWDREGKAKYGSGE